MKGKRGWLIFWGILLLVGRVSAGGGEVLERPVCLPGMRATVYSLLGKVSEQSGYLFVYDSRLVNNDAVVKTKSKTCTLRQAIYEIIGNATLELKVTGNHILILPSVSKMVEPKEETITLQPASTAVSGTLLDRETGEPVLQATVMIQGTSIGSVTNQEGEFRIQLPDSLRDATLFFSHVGYMPQEIAASLLTENHSVLSLEPRIVPLQEVLIRLVEPKKLLKEMMAHREQNYGSPPVYLTTFYREGVQLKDKFQSLTEAVFKVYKTTLATPHLTDQVKLLKMHRMDNLEVSDSLIAKIRAGIQACLQLDVMKELPDFLSSESENRYVYTTGDVTFVEDRCVNVIYFEQRTQIQEPLFCGELYIDLENGALLKARIEIHPKYVKEATRTYVVRQTPQTKLTTHKIVYTLSYRPWEGTYYIHHVRGDLYFKVKRKRTLFSQPTLHTWFEMVTCRVDTENVARFPRTDRLPIHTIFAETDYRYNDDFWEEFNIIPLEEEWSRIIEKVSLKVEQTVP